MDCPSNLEPGHLPDWSQSLSIFPARHPSAAVFPAPARIALPAIAQPRVYPHLIRMKSLALAACLTASIFATTQARAATQECLVLGDSLTKEYQVEFPALYPENPQAWKARNWIEVLAAQRNAWFDMGKFTAFADPRITGHEYNWAFPGAETQDLRNALSSTDWYNTTWHNTLRSELKSNVTRVVIFAGGNDVHSYYGDIYNGKSPTLNINKTRDNLMWLVDYVRSVRTSLQIVLVAVPHIGCTPDVQAAHPTDPVKTARVTAALDSLNSQLASLAKSRGIGFASGVYDFSKGLITKPFVIGGVTINKQADANARNNYAFSGDGFHPGTAAQARIGQIILDTFRAKWPSPVIAPLTDAEILKVLGLK